MEKTDVKTIICVLLSAAAAFLLGEAVIYLCLQNGISLIITEGLHFALLGFIIILFLVISTYHFSPLKDELSATAVFKKVAVLLTLGVLLLSFLFGGLFQYLYNMNIVGRPSYKNYVVAIDNSGSMEQTDPGFKRYDAVSELMEIFSKDQQLAIYTFSDGTKNIFPLQKIDKAKIPEYMADIRRYAYSDGGTNAMGVLSHITSEIPDTDNAIIILISDGQCDVDHSVLDSVKNNNMIVHAVQVAGASDINSLREIADATGGDFYKIDEISGLEETFAGIHNQNYDFMLTDRRPDDMASSPTHMLLRLAFIFLLALIIKIFQILTVDISRLRKSLILQAILFSIAAACATEFLFALTPLSSPVVRLIMTILISLIIASYIPRALNSGSNNIFRDAKPRGFDKAPDKIIR